MIRFKNILLGVVCIVFLFSCEQHILDKPFYAVNYDKDFSDLSRDSKVKMEDLFLMNYSITRHRDYFDYEVKGIPYLEIIKQARELKEKGIGVVQKFDESPLPTSISASISNIKRAVIPKKNRPSRKVKHLKFSCTFTNTTSSNIAINYATFIINGPFGQHLMTAGYETNCMIPAGESQRMHFVMEAKKIRSNLFFEKSNDVTRLMFDDLFEKFQVEIGGIELADDATNYNECFANSMVREPFAYSNYKELFPDGIKVEEIDGKPTVHFGTKLYTRDDDDSIINYN